MVGGKSGTTNLRYPLPGEVGERNFYRGDGYFGVGRGLIKTRHVSEKKTLKFNSEVFNATSSVRFDTRSRSQK